MNLKTCLLLIFLLSPFLCKAQLTDDYEYDREYIGGLTTNTNSGLIGGIIFKYGKAIKPNVFEIYGVEIVEVRHNKEKAIPSPQGGTFVWQKVNYLFAIRGQYGREYTLFRKAPQQGVQINAIFAGGPTFGLLAPYFIRYNSNELVPFDPSIHTTYSNVIGTGSMLQGLSNSKIRFGAHYKTSLNMELGTFKSNVTGFEIGFMVEAYSKRVEIMSDIETIKNNFLFPSAFFTLYYGRRR
ncbi:hypothetical protein [Xanthovirga aplysinae]|uniref:hypothetical protein n=1 Tax=Xanthovirga aplysinae TaxID=2529853 RepID=UPI0012BC4C97|nr:hypothetical protein [Xanthovirga aplysinae]MTI32506.1 hypothetical protein [Xanthovirga aplysinae]